MILFEEQESRAIFLINPQGVGMRAIIKITIISFLVIHLSACDLLINMAGPEFLKIILKGICGEEDAACIAAVDSQFDGCHSNNKGAWDKYMNSTSSKEDELLEKYSIALYRCIVDENGDPYFTFDPEQ